MAETKIFDAENAIFGRMGAVVAKELLKGNSVVVINSEKAIFSGEKKLMVEKLRAKLRMGRSSSLKGPQYSRREDFLMKRMFRGMLPWDRQKGRDAYKRLKCFVGSENLKEEEKKKAIKFEHKKLKNILK
jgi:large subunit ribosomal protein L13